MGGGADREGEREGRRNGWKEGMVGRKDRGGTRLSSFLKNKKFPYLMDIL